MATSLHLEPSCVVVAELAGARVTKFRPAVVVSSDLYHQQRPDIIVGVLTTQRPHPEAATDYLLLDWEQAGLRAPSWFRLYLITIEQPLATLAGRLSARDWTAVQERLQRGLAVGAVPGSP
jgi:mRNA interferase MazF